jgi:hypothetical protein
MTAATLAKTAAPMAPLRRRNDPDVVDAMAASVAPTRIAAAASATPSTAGATICPATMRATQ